MIKICGINRFQIVPGKIDILIYLNSFNLNARRLPNSRNL